MAYSLGTAEGRIVVDGSGARAGFAVAQAAAESFFNVIKDKIDKVQDLGQKLTRFGAIGAAGFGLAVHAAADFEATLSGIQAVSGATTAEMEGLRAKALQIGKDTTFSAGEAAQAMEELLKAGVSTQDVMTGAAEATTALAAAGGIDLPDAATIAANALNNFGLSGKDMAHTADLIAGAANASAIDVGDFGFSLSQAGAVAHLTGLAFDDLAVAIAEMGQAGIKGSDAGTSIKTFLQNLIPQTDQQVQAFRDLGLISYESVGAMQKLKDMGLKPVSDSYGDVSRALAQYAQDTKQGKIGTDKNAKAVQDLMMGMGLLKNQFFDAQGNMKSFADVQETLHEATKNLTKEQKLQTLGMLFGSDAIRAAAVFADEGAAGYNKMADAMGKVTAAQVAATRLDNLKGSLEALKGSFETVAIEAGSMLLPAVRAIVQGVNTLVNAFLNLPDGVRKAIYVLAAVVTGLSLLTGALIAAAFAIAPLVASFLGMLAIRSVISIFAALFSTLIAGAGPVAAVTAMFARFMLLFGRLTTAIRIIVGAWRLISAAISLLTGPVGIAIGVITLLGMAFYEAYKHSETFRNFVNSVASTIMGVLAPAIETGKAAIAALVQGFNSMQAGSGTSLAAIFQTIGAAAAWFLGQLQSLWSWFQGNFMSSLQQAGQTIMSSLGPAFSQLSDTVTGQLWPALQGLGAALAPALPALAFLGKLILGVVVVALFALVAAITAVAVVLAAIIPPIIAFGAALISGLVGVLSTVASAIVSVFSGLVQLITGIIGAISQAVQGNWAAAWASLVSAAQGGVAAITAVFNGLLFGVIGIVQAFVNAVIALFTTLWDVLVGHSIVPDMINAIIQWFVSLPGAVLGVIAGFVGAVIGFFAGLFASVVGIVSGGIGSVVATFSGLPGRVMGAIASLLGSLVAAAASWMSGMAGAVRAGIGAVTGAMGAVKSGVIGVFAGAAGWLVGAGRSIISGLVSGIRSAIGSVKAALGAVTSMIPSWKGPESVDKKLLVNAGKLVMKGFVDGINAGLPEVKKTLNGVAPSIQTTVGYMADRDDSRTRRSQERRSATVESGAAGHSFVFNAYGDNAVEASDQVARRMRAMSAMGAFG